MFFTTLQESLRIQKDGILGTMDKDWSTTFKFLPPSRNELLCSKMAHLDGHLQICIYISDFYYLDLIVSRSLAKYSEISIALHLSVSLARQ